jgi:hypothetical protein
MISSKHRTVPRANRVYRQYVPEVGPPPQPHPDPAVYPPPPGYALAYPTPYGYPIRPGYPPPPPPDPEEGWSGLAIASLILGFLGAVLLSVTLAITALIQLRRSGQRGRGLAIGGLVLSGVWVLVVVSLLAVAVARSSGSETTTTADRAVAGTSTSDQSAIDATGYAPGDCVDEIDDYDTMHEVSCTPAHDGEVFAVFTLPDGRWPGEDEVEYTSDARCSNYLDGYVEQPFAFEYFSYYPSQDMWPQDRSVVCVAYDQEGPLYGSIHH